MKKLGNKVCNTSSKELGKTYARKVQNNYATQYARYAPRN